MNLNFDNDDLDDIEDNHFNIYSGYTDGVSPLKNAKNRPTVSYLYIDLDKTDYKFHQPDFGDKESKIYLSKMKYYAEIPLKDLIDHSKHKDHFKVSQKPTSKELELISQLMSVKINDENMPITGHFALYTEPYEEGKKTKAPRIHFIVGEQSVMHVLFYDPFHEIHPMGESTKRALSK